MNVDQDLIALYRNSRDFNNSINKPVIRTGNGIFYSGMTLNDAKMVGRDKCIMRRDFSDVDKNKEGILSHEEILRERDNEVKRLGVDSLVMGAFAVWDTVSCVKKFSLWNLAFAALFTGFTIDSISRKSKLKAANEALRQQLSINA